MDGEKENLFSTTNTTYITDIIASKINIKKSAYTSEQVVDNITKRVSTLLSLFVVTVLRIVMFVQQGNGIVARMVLNQ